MMVKGAAHDVADRNDIVGSLGSMVRFIARDATPTGLHRAIELPGPQSDPAVPIAAPHAALVTVHQR